jgi:hypothetical protein
MKRIIILLSILTGICIILVTGCDMMAPPVSNENSINDNFYALKKPVQAAYDGDVTSLGPGTPEGECMVYPFTVKRGFTYLPCFDPGTQIIFPGALLDGASIVSGEYRPIYTSRKSVDISCSITNTQYPVTAFDVYPDIGNMRNAINGIVWTNKEAPVAANIFYNFSSIYTYDHLLVELGMKAHGGFSSIFGGIETSLTNEYDWESEKEQTKILVKYIQVYYSCDITPPENPSDFFADKVAWDDLKNKITPGITPGYVASIKYGRILLFFLQSSEEETKVREAFKASLEISYAGITAGGQTTLTIEQEEIIKRCKISAIIRGGDSSTATPVCINPGNLGDYLTSGKNATVNTPVVPLSYQVNYLSDNTWMTLVLGTSGYFRLCGDNIPTPTEPPVQQTETRVLEFTEPGDSYWYPATDIAGDIITVRMVGGGGGGGGSFSGSGSIAGNSSGNGEGGRAGQYVAEQTLTINKNLTYRIVVGEAGRAGANGGGGGGAGTDAVPGSAGGSSSLSIVGASTLIETTGGAGGRAASGYTRYTYSGQKSGEPQGYGDGGNGGRNIIGSTPTVGHCGYVRITYTAYVQ